MPIQVFGAGAVQTAYVGYLNLDLAQGNIVLVWPTSYVDVPYSEDGINYNVLAASMWVTTGDDNTNTIRLPDATMSTVGSNFIITNIGVSSFNLLTANGNTLITVPITPLSNSYWVILADNSTQEGLWHFVRFGAGTSSADASVLAGNGLTAIGTTLNTNVVVEKKMVDYNVISSDRAKLVIWKGGEGEITLPLIGSVPSGFYLSFSNQGTGELSISGNGASIDEVFLSLNLIDNQSVTIISDGTSWWTLGLNKDDLSNAFPNGGPGNPSITFVNDSSTGIYYSPIGPYLGFSVSGRQTGQFTQEDGVSSTFSITNSVNPAKKLSLKANETTGVVSYNDIETLSISDTGVLTLLSAPLPIESGGTGQNTAASAINALIPGGANNNLVTHNGTTWVPLAAPLPLNLGGTGATSQPAAINNLMPTTGASLLAYYNGANWVPTQGTPTNGYSLRIQGGIPTWMDSTSSIIVPIASGGTGQTTQAAAITALMPSATAGQFAQFNGTTWTAISQIPLSAGGTNANLTASNGGIFYSTASAGAILAGTPTANRMLLSGASTAPSWSTSSITLGGNFQTNNQLTFTSSGASTLTLSTSGTVVSVTSNVTCGSATLASGTVVVNTTAIQTTSIVLVNRNAGTGAPSTAGFLAVGNITAGTSFRITSSSILDTGVVNWLIINP